MTRKRRLKRSRRTRRDQRGGAQRVAPKMPPTDICKGLPFPVNGLEYSTRTEAFIKNQPQQDYKTFFDANCKPMYYLSTNRSSPYSIKEKYMIIQNKEKVLFVVDKWSALLQPISAPVVGTSLGDRATQTNVNPFKTYYDQLQTYKRLLDNKSALSSGSVSSLAKGAVTGMLTMGASVDSEVFYSQENILETFNSINAEYNYYKGIPFNMKEFLGFEKIGGWMGTEASRKKAMETIDGEVLKLAGDKKPAEEAATSKDEKKKKMETERLLKIEVSKAALILSLYVFCYLNYMPIPKGNMDMDTINRMIQTLNTFYAQINRFSVGGTPKEVEKLLTDYKDGFETNLAELTKEMAKKTAKPIVGGAFFRRTKQAVIQGARGVRTGWSGQSGANTQGQVGILPKKPPNSVEGVPTATIGSDVELVQNPLTSTGSTVSEGELGNELADDNELLGAYKHSRNYGQTNLKVVKRKNTLGHGAPALAMTNANENSRNPPLDPSPAEGETKTDDGQSAPAISSNKSVENQAKEYQPTKQPIATEKTSGDYKIADEALQKALGVYGTDPSPVHRDIVIAEYQKLLKIAERDLESAKKETEFPKKAQEKQDIMEKVQTEFDQWKAGLDGTQKGQTKLDPDKVDAEVIRLKIKKKEVEGKIAQLNSNDTETLAKLVEEKTKIEEEIKKAEASSDLQRGFLSEELSYEKTIAYLYRPKETKDPLLPFYDAIKKDEKDMVKLYEFLSGEDLLDGDENVTNLNLEAFIKKEAFDKSGGKIEDLRTAAKSPNLSEEDKKHLAELEALEKENKMRARTHFFMKVLYSFAKGLEKTIKHAEVLDFGQNTHAFDATFDKNRLNEMKRYLKERARSETLCAIQPKGVENYGFVRLYNSEEYKQANAMFSLKEVQLEHVFDNTAYFKDRGFVFIEDPGNYRGMFVKYYYDEDDYVNGKPLEKPEFIEKEVVKGFLPFGQPKEEKPKAAYEEVGSEKGIGVSSDKFLEKASEASKLGVKAGTMTYEGIAGKEASTKEKKVIKQMSELPETHENEVRKESIKQAMTGGGTDPEPRSKMAMAGTIVKKGVGAVAGTVVGAVATAVVGALGVVLSLVYFPFMFAAKVIYMSCFLTAYSAGQVAGYFSELVDDNSYKNLGKLADTKSKECEEIVKMLAMNTHQKEDERINQLLLSVLSNVYNAVDYIQKAEEKFRDKHEYDISVFMSHVENLMATIKKAPFDFGTGSLYQSMNDPKKMLYFVYAILMKCKPKTLEEAKGKKKEDIEKPEEVLQARIGKLKGKIEEIKEDIKVLRANNPSQSTAEKERKKDALEKEVDDLEIKKETALKAKKLKGETEDLDKEINEEKKTSAETLKKNEKPIKELLSKTPPIVFDMKEVEPLFEKPVTYLYKRYNKDNGKKQIDPNKRVNLITGVDMLVPSILPALASVFLYKTDELDPVEVAKQAEAKEAAKIKSEQDAIKSKEAADRKSKETVAAANLKAAQLAKATSESKNKMATRVPEPVRPPIPVKAKEPNKPVNKPLNKPVNKTVNKAGNKAVNTTKKLNKPLSETTVTNTKKATGPRKVCVKKTSGTTSCYTVKTSMDGKDLSIEPIPG